MVIIPREIEYFIRIVEDRNLSKAADTLCISQPALSKYLSKLENDMGVRLASRNGAFITLTEEGKIYYEAAKNIVNLLKMAERKMEDIRATGPKHLVIGTSGDRSQVRMGEFLKPMFQDFPSLQFKFVEENRKELIRQMKQNEIDLGFFSPFEEDPEIEQVPLYTTEIQLAISPNHPLSSKLDPEKPVDLKELQQERFVLSSTRTAFRKRIDAYLKEHGIGLNIAIETRSKYAALSYVETGTVIGFYPKKYYIKPDNLIYLDLKDKIYTYGAISYKKGSYLTEQAKHFISLAEEYYRSQD